MPNVNLVILDCLPRMHYMPDVIEKTVDVLS